MNKLTESSNLKEIVEKINEIIDSFEGVKIGSKVSKIKIPPTLEEVEKYCRERKNGISPIGFIDFYDSKGWMIGKNKMKNWQAAIRTWEGKREEVVKDKSESQEEKVEYYQAPQEVLEMARRLNGRN